MNDVVSIKLIADELVKLVFDEEYSKARSIAFKVVMGYRVSKDEIEQAFNYLWQLKGRLTGYKLRLESMTYDKGLSKYVRRNAVRLKSDVELEILDIDDYLEMLRNE